MAFSIVQRNADNVLVSGDFGSGEAVVTQGVHGVREGSELRILSDSRPLGVDGALPAASVTRTGT